MSRIIPNQKFIVIFICILIIQSLFILIYYNWPTVDNHAKQPIVESILNEVEQNKVDIASQLHNLTIIELHLIWKCLFYYQVIKQQFISTLDTVPSSPKFEVQCKKLLYFNPPYNKTYYIQLTQQHIDTKHITNYRYLVSIRRYIMLLTESSSYHYYLQLIATLHKMEAQYKINLDNSLKMKKKKYFIIHPKKCGGTSICSTFNKLGYNTTSPTGYNCNLAVTNAAWKTKDYGALTCSAYFKYAQDRNVDMIGYERVMHGHSISIKPILCDEFIYILPIREPMQRMYSSLEQVVIKMTQPSDFIIRREIARDSNDTQIKNIIYSHLQTLPIVNKKWRYPMVNVFDIVDNNTNEHRFYTPLYRASDFNGFFKHLLYDKYQEDDDIVTQIDFSKNDIYKYVETKSNLNEQENIYKIYWFGGKEYNKFGFKVIKHWNKKRKIQKIEGINFDFVKGWLLNIYVRFFGFEHIENMREITYDAYYAKNKDVGLDYFINAVDLLMMINYILPFENKLQHPMWRYLFEIIKENSDNNTKIKYWKHDNDGNLFGKQIFALELDEWINTRNIENALSEEEKNLLKNEIKYDIWLYNIANMIADLDASFYKTDNG